MQNDARTKERRDFQIAVCVTENSGLRQSGNGGRTVFGGQPAIAMRLVYPIVTRTKGDKAVKDVAITFGKNDTKDRSPSKRKRLRLVVRSPLSISDSGANRPIKHKASGARALYGQRIAQHKSHH